MRLDGTQHDREMAKEPKTIDVSQMPEALRIAEEVRATNEPRVLCRDSVELAVVMPLPQSRRRSPRGKVFTKDDALMGLVGIGRSGGPGDVSENKHKYLAEADKNKSK